MEKTGRGDDPDLPFLAPFVGCHERVEGLLRGTARPEQGEPRYPIGEVGKRLSGDGAVAGLGCGHVCADRKEFGGHGYAEAAAIRAAGDD